MNKGTAPFVITAEPFGPPDGKSLSFPLLLGGLPARNVSRVSAVYRVDNGGVAVKVTDYTFDGTQIKFAQVLPASAGLLWDGEVIRDVLVREPSDHSRIVKGQPVGQTIDGSRIRPLTVGGSVYRAISRVDGIYREDWQGRLKLSTTPRTTYVPNSLCAGQPWSVNKSGVADMPTVTGRYATAPDGRMYAARVQMSNSGGSAADYCQVTYCGGVAEGSNATQSFYARSTDGMSTYVLMMRQGNATKLITVTPKWTLFQINNPNQTIDTTFGSLWLRGGQGTSPAADVLVAYPQLELGAVPTSRIDTSGAYRTVLDYRLVGADVVLGEASSAPLTWDGEVFWKDVPSLLPPNATPQERAIEAATARIGDIGAPLRALKNPAACPVELLPWLAWELSVDTWRPEWPEHIKRSRLASAIAIQRYKGTVQSVRDVVESFGGAVEMVEWWQKTPKGIPHTFDLTLTLSGNDGSQATAQFTDDVIGEVNKTKPVRSHFTFTQGVALYGAVGVAPYVRPVVMARLEFTGS